MCLLCVGRQARIKTLAVISLISENCSLCVQNIRMTVVCEDPDCWISRLPLTSDASAANCSIYSQGDFFSNARQYDIYLLAAFKIRICVSNSRKQRSNTTCAFYAARFPVVTPSCLFSGEDLFCKVMKELTAGERLVAFVSPVPLGSSSPVAQGSPPLSLVAHKQPVVKEEPSYPAALHSEIQLLPQQAGMAAILATAVVNSECCIQEKSILSG